MKKALIGMGIAGLLAVSTVAVVSTKAAVKPDGYSAKQTKVVTVKSVAIDSKTKSRITSLNSENKKIRDQMNKDILAQKKKIAKETLGRNKAIVKNRK